MMSVRLNPINIMIAVFSNVLAQSVSLVQMMSVSEV
jgi:hypothetical protein